MKTMMSVLFAGVVLASVSTATANDQWAEERLKAKTGRYSPAEESRRKALAQSQQQSDEECEQHACCRRDHRSVGERKDVTTGSVWATELLKAKLGRSPEAAHNRSDQRQLAGNQGSAFSDAWRRAKWGRSMSDAPSTSRTTPEVIAANICGRPSCCD